MRALDTLFWRIVLPVPILLVIGIAAMLFVVPWVVRDNVERTARETALELIETVRSIRNYYSDYVILDALDRDALDVGLLHRGVAGTIPAPATFIQEMTRTRGEREISINQLSPFPFKGRERPPLDDFQMRAWNALHDDPAAVFTATEEIAGRRVVRVAVADRMSSQTCVDCHNGHPASIRTGWSLGDVRGLLEVQTVVDKPYLRGSVLAWGLTLVLVLAGLVVTAINAINARRLARPLGEMSRAMLNLAGGNSRFEPPKGRQTRELRELVDAFSAFRERDEEREALYGRIHQLAFYDDLTALPNRTLFCERLDHQLDSARRKAGSRIVLMLIDLDHFRDINNTLGRDVGDEILSEAGRRLQQLRARHRMVARLGEDEFGIMLYFEEEADREDAEALGEAYGRGFEGDQVRMLQELIATPIAVEGHYLYLSASVGISVFPQDGTTREAMMRNADLALYHAKQSGRGTSRYFTGDLEHAVAERVQMTRELRHGIENDELYPHFQPQFDLNTGVLIGVETLLRWRREDGTNVPPNQFIPIAEQSGLIVPIGRKVLRDACEAAVAWEKAGLLPIRIAANVSAIEFREDDFVENLERTLEQTGMPPERLELEVTEGAMMMDIDLVVDVLTKLRRLGLELAIDDFGTGYSSLSYLRRLPVDRLKIDQAFVRHVTTNEDDANIARTIIALAHNLGLNVLAEGVETAEHAAFLRDEGCEEAQGYHYAKPMPAEEFLAFAKACQKAEPDLHRSLAQSKRRLKAI